MAFRNFKVVLNLKVNSEFLDTPNEWDWQSLLALEGDEGELVKVEQVLETTEGTKSDE